MEQKNQLGLVTESNQQSSMPALWRSSQETPWIRTKKDLELYQCRNEKQIAEFTALDYKPLISLLTWWREMLGITAAPSEHEKEMCLVHIRESYADMTIPDIKLAVKYSLEGEFEVDAVAYNSFSPAYISRILNGYKKYKDRQLYKILKEKEAHEQKAKEAQVLDPHESRRRYLLWYISEVKKSDSYIIDFKSITYDVTERVKGDFFNPDQFYFEATEMHERLKSELNTIKFGSVISETDIPTPEKLQKYLQLKEYFSKLENPELWIVSLTDEILIPKI